MTKSTSPAAGPVKRKSVNVDLGPRDFALACAELAGQASSFNPDLIVGIATGGVYVAEEMQPHLGNIPVAIIKLQRPGTAVKEKLGARAILKFLPERVTNVLRRIEVWFREKHLQRGIAAPQGVPRPAENWDESVTAASRIIVVDDTIDSGRTIAAVIDYIAETNAAAEVQTAVIASTWQNPPLTPDHCLYDRTLVRFPWSMDASSTA